jgi:hypothetical protein
MLLSAYEHNLKNPGDASASAPVATNAPGELIANDGWAKHLDLATAGDAELADKRAIALQRIVRALDIVDSVGDGTQDEANHWSGWQVSEENYKIFIQPLLKAIGGAVVEFWFREVLRAMGEENPERFTLGWDTTDIVARPDDTENLRDLHDRLIISDDYMAAENGIPEDARPNAEEYTRRFLERTVAVAPTLLADPNVAKALGLDIEVAPAATGVPGEIEGGELQPETPPEPSNALPERAAEPDGGDVPEGLVAAANVVALRALERAGGKLLTREYRGQYANVPKWELHCHIKPLNPEACATEAVTEDFLAASAVPFEYAHDIWKYVADRLRTGQPHDMGVLRRYL